MGPGYFYFLNLGDNICIMICNVIQCTLYTVQSNAGPEGGREEGIDVLKK